MSKQRSYEQSDVPMPRERSTEEKLDLVIARLVNVEAAQKRWDERFAKLAWFDEERSAAVQTAPGLMTFTVLEKE